MVVRMVTFEVQLRGYSRMEVDQLIARAVLTVGGGVLGTGAPAGATGGRFPTDIPLPNGWRPEGLTIGRGTSFYVGSLVDGAVFRGDLATGRGGVLVPGTPGTAKTGLQ